jgi:hypothetical protein
MIDTLAIPFGKFILGLVKTIFSIPFLAIAALFVGCAATEQSVEGVGEQFQEGVQGRGRIVQMDITSDEFGPMYR